MSAILRIQGLWILFVVVSAGWSFDSWPEFPPTDASFQDQAWSEALLRQESTDWRLDLSQYAEPQTIAYVEPDQTGALITPESDVYGYQTEGLGTFCWDRASDQRSSLATATKKMMILQGLGFGAMVAAGVWDDDDEYGSIGLKNWTDGWTVTPEFENRDSPAYNWVAHPIVGSEYYLLARNRGAGVCRSFWYSALMSAFWEYMIENFAENPSATDLIVTPCLGSVLGELRYQAKQRVLAKGGQMSSRDWMVLKVLDPMDVMVSCRPGGGPQFGLNWTFPF